MRRFLQAIALLAVVASGVAPVRGQAGEPELRKAAEDILAVERRLASGLDAKEQKRAIRERNRLEKEARGVARDELSSEGRSREMRADDRFEGREVRTFEGRNVPAPRDTHGRERERTRENRDDRRGRGDDDSRVRDDHGRDDERDGDDDDGDDDDDDDGDDEEEEEEEEQEQDDRDEREIPD